MSAKTLAQTAYEATNQCTPWEALPPAEQHAWEEVVAAVQAHANPPAPQRCYYLLFITTEQDGFTSLFPPQYEQCSLLHEHGGPHVSWTRTGAWLQNDRGQRRAQYRRKEN